MPEIIGKIVEVLTDEDNIRTVLEGAVTLMMAVVQAIPTLITNLLQELPDIIDNILSVLTDKENFRIILDGAKSLMNAVIQAIPEILVALASALPDIITSLVEFFLDPDNFAMVLTAVVELMGALLAAIPQICQKLGEKLPEILTAIGEGLAPLGDFFAGIWDNLVETFKGVGEWFGNAFSEAWTNIENAFATVGEFFTGIWDTITGIFTKIGTTIGNAVDGAFHTVLDQVISWVESAVNGVIGWINGIIDGINNTFGTSIGHIGEVNFTGKTSSERAYANATAEEQASMMAAFYSKVRQNVDTAPTPGSGRNGTEGGRASTTYVQNINAPQSPSRADIYRDTKNLLALTS